MPRLSNLHLSPMTLIPKASKPPANSTRQDLESNYESLRAKMRDTPVWSTFNSCKQAPDYLTFCGSDKSQSFFGALKKYDDFFASKEGVFITASRLKKQCEGEYDGDKFHINVHPEQLEHAFQAISGLLLSQDSLIDSWKVVDLRKVEPGSRVREGAQFTLYVKPTGQDSHYDGAELGRLRTFIELLDATLSEQHIQSGRRLDSDIGADHWKYVSYRNEKRGERFPDEIGGIEVNQQKMQQEPFYRLMAEPVR